MFASERHPLASSILVIGACLVLTGCATDQRKLLQFLATTHTPMSNAEYRVMPPDVLSVTANPAPEYAGLNVRVGPDGKAFLPLVGELHLANKTTTEIAAELTENLQDYYEDVQVTVAVEGYLSQKYFVFGEVGRPGVYAYRGSDTLLSALASAGPTRLAMPEKIYLVRGLHALPGDEGIEVDENGLMKNNVQKITINLWEMARDGKLPGNVALANNDVIYVPAHPLAKVGLALQNLLFPAKPAIDVAHVPSDIGRGVGPRWTGVGDGAQPR